MEDIDTEYPVYAVHGLQSVSGRLFNGRLVQVMGHDRQSGRIIVRINPQDPKRDWKKLNPACLHNICPSDMFEHAAGSAAQSMASWEAFDLPCVGALLPTKDCICQEICEVYRILDRFGQLMMYDGGLCHMGSGQRRPDFRHRLWKPVIHSICVLLLHFSATRLEAYLMKLDAFVKGVHLLELHSEAECFSGGFEASEVDVTLPILLKKLDRIRWYLMVAHVFAGCFPTLGSCTGFVRPVDKVAPNAEGYVPFFEDVDHQNEAGAERDEVLAQVQADHDWADSVEQQIRANAEVNEEARDAHIGEHIFLFPYMRAPSEFMQALLIGPEMQHIREEMSAQDCPYVLEGSGAKIFVWPEQYQKVLQELEASSVRLRSSHVIVAESILPCLEASIATIPSQKNVRVKKDRIFTLACIPTASPAAEDHQGHQLADPSDLVQEIDKDIQMIEDWKHVLAVERTFICTVRLLRDSQSVTQTTTEVHGALNPRRVVG